MRLDRFDLNLLVVLDVMLEERNVTRASERLFIGQSAASGALARLREYFDDELLVVSGRRLVLTPFAESLIEPVRETLVQARATLARKSNFDPATSDRRFAICASDYVTTVFLADTIRRLASIAPRIFFEIRNPKPDTIETFANGQIDLLIMPEQYVSRLQQPQETLFADTNVCMVCAANALVGDTITFDQYLAMGHVAVRFGDEMSVAFEGWFLPRKGKQRVVELSLNDFSAIPLALFQTNRIATLHRRQAEFFAKYFPVRIIEAPFEMPQVVEQMAWPHHLDHDPAHRWLRSELRESARQLQNK